MPTINKLDNALINKIAAGEVIERPASVVKELIENAIDAEATKISVEIKESGFSLIKVIDNGKGMDKEDAKLSIERHATSKIKEKDDLFKIKTLGFRGEALASIAAISNIKITTKRKKDKEAYQISAEAGRIYNEKELGYQDGTTLEIKDLFFNVPARKKFLKNFRLEFQNIVDIVSRYALISPKIFFKLVHNGKNIFIAPSTSDWQGSIINIYGKDTAKELLPVNYSDGTYEIMGFVSKPKLTRADKTHQSIYVNNRYVKNSTITSGIYDAYHTLLFNHRHPVVVLNISVEPKLIDVNVHPTKKEIRINREQEMKEAVQKAVGEALEKDNLVPKDTDRPQRIFIDDIKFEREKFKKRYKIEKSRQQELEFDEKEINTGKEDRQQTEEEEQKYNILGQVHNCYIIAEDEEGILLIDQHAAEERINYERFMEMYHNKNINIQELLEPIMFELEPKDSTAIQNKIEKFKNIGFDIEEFGHNSFILRTLPVVLGKLQDKKKILDLIDEVKSLNNLEENMLIMKACKASIKQGDALSNTQMYDLLKRLNKAKVPYTCPHGRPTMIKMTKQELERKFKRKG